MHADTSLFLSSIQMLPPRHPLLHWPTLDSCVESAVAGQGTRRSSCRHVILYIGRPLFLESLN